MAGLLDITVEERDADDAFLAVDDRRIDILAVDLEILLDGLAGVAQQPSLVTFSKHCPQRGIHVREPGWDRRRCRR